MITTITVKSFKSIEDITIELGNLNVFVGANGSGKSNLLEAVGVLSAAADGKVTDQTLLQRGVRPGVPKLYKSAFPDTEDATRQSSHIFFSGASTTARYDVSLNNPLSDPCPAWRFKSERLMSGEIPRAGRGPNSRNSLNPENGLAALELVTLDEADPALTLMRRLQNYVIYSPTTPVLRGVAPETQPRQPLGLSGGRLPEAVQELLSRRTKSKQVETTCMEALELISWAKSFGSAPATDLPLSPAAGASPRVVKFVDRYMKEADNVLSGYDASEGALVVLFLAVLAAHPKAPSFFAIDNADYGLNPGLATSLMKHFADWVLNSEDQRQILLTSHNPAVLDGLPLQDDRVRLFTVDRDNKGKAIVKRVAIDQRLLDLSDKGWTLSRLWMNKLIGGMPNV
ncbi:AAA family ATPase [uncultured Thiodictyon sp.]|uniref:AAA family ATPase n=1 Tax=uncultured Thiodictyon sp. TaxID=1846217 RepID=UPI0025CF2F8C|nr:AAA family ATPase [uncultured Thiodictyon sp.]